jgi:broad specificity phosphatase PhoE
MRCGGRTLGLVLVVGLTLMPAATAGASEHLWTLLKAGGQVVLIRHAITTPGVGDPPGMRLDDCSSQRNLTDEGRRDARRLGEAFRARGLPVDRVLSSPWCRCLETARLAFGAAEPWSPLSNLFGRPEQRAEQVRQMQALVGEQRTGGNLVLVSHGSTISVLTGVSLDTSEMVVVTPLGGGQFTVAGRLRLMQWGAPTWPPKPPNVRSAPGHPGRSSITRGASGGLADA